MMTGDTVGSRMQAAAGNGSKEGDDSSRKIEKR